MLFIVTSSLFMEAYLWKYIFTFSGISCLDQQEHDDLSCGPEEFKCLQLNLNQILTMHDWNLHPKVCVHMW